MARLERELCGCLWAWLPSLGLSVPGGSAAPFLSPLPAGEPPWLWPLLCPPQPPPPNPHPHPPTAPAVFPAWVNRSPTLDPASDLDSGFVHFLLPDGFLILPLAIEHKKVPHPF